MHSLPIAAGKSSFDLIDSKEFFSRIGLAANAQVLDMACGVGRYSLAMAELVTQGTVYAVDLWDEGIETLEKTVRERGIERIRQIKGDITKRLPLADRSVDVCLMATILHDLAPAGRSAALHEAARVLKSGGTLAVVEFKKIDRGPGPPAAIRLTEEEAEMIIGNCGFRKTYGGDVGEYNYLLLFQKAI